MTNPRRARVYRLAARRWWIACALLLGLTRIVSCSGDDVSGPRIAVMTATLPAGAVGVAYGATLGASGGDGTYVWTLANGTLPDGLALDASGAIAGTPTAGGNFGFTVEVASAGGRATRAFTLGIAAPLQISSTTRLPAGIVGQPYQTALAVTGGDASNQWSLAAGALPAGLTLSAAGVIAGTPTVIDTAEFELRVSNALGQTTTMADTLATLAAPVVTTSSLLRGAVGVAYQAALAASGGDGTYVWALAAGGLPDGLTLAADGAITGTPGAGGSFSLLVQATSAGVPATRELTLAVAPALQIAPAPLPPVVVGRAYSFTWLASGGDGGNVWSLASGALPAGLTLSADGVLTGTAAAAGTAEFVVRVTNPLGQTTTTAATLIVVMPVAITTTTLPRSAVGYAYDVALAASGGGGMQQWSVHSGSLPAGLGLSAGGVVSGTPTAAGVSVFGVVVVDRYGLADTTQLSLEVLPPPGVVVPNLKVAFIGDQGSGQDAVSVLQLIRDEGADMVIHSGDFDYEDNPTRWDQTITSVLGASFPYFASVGNHDESRFYGRGGYQEKLTQRVARVPDATCTGDLGVNSSCRYQGLFFILSGAGTLGTGHESYLRQELAADNSIWRICSWHKNQNAMQVGGKSDEVGWGPYEACRELGGIIATAHEHLYSRTRTLVNTQLQTVDAAWPAAETVRVTPGATFVFVSGLGGSSVRDQERCFPTTFPYGCNGEWASIYTANHGATHGALCIEFHVDGDQNRARGYFKNINGTIVDQFTVTAQPLTPR
jgi:3',5'-cyclic AMP phosphodiesterase CpdA